MSRPICSVALLLLAALIGNVIADHNCISMPSYCMHGALCHDNDASSTTHWSGAPVCECNPPYFGTNCETTVKDCHDNPCANGGSCTPSDTDVVAGDYFKCTCPKGYGGSRCEYPSACSSSPCKNGAVCQDHNVNTKPGFICDCSTAFNFSHAFSGALCQFATSNFECNQTRFTFAQPCQNGTCVATGLPSPSPTSQCQCNAKVYGRYCENNFCVTNNCLNGGTCQYGMCYCALGYYGTNCEKSYGADFCASSPCQNGGNCLPSGNFGFGSCNCTLGYSGTYCQNYTADWCTPSPCQNGATCQSLLPRGTGQCLCTNDYVGTYCAYSKSAFCASNPCKNGGLCLNATNTNAGFCDCSFSPNATGPFCDIVYSPTGCALGNCSGSCLCTSKASCVANKWNDNCICAGVAPGELIHIGGSACNVTTAAKCNIHPASPNYPCEHGGTCIEHRDGVLCACLKGFYGSRCQYYRNPCNPNPCLNGGECSFALFPSTLIAGWSSLATSGSYLHWSCECKYPYYGPNCANYAYGPNICPSVTSVGFVGPTPYCPAAPTKYGAVECIAQQHPFNYVVLYKGLRPAVVYPLLGKCDCQNTSFTGPNCDLSVTEYVTFSNAKKGQVIPSNCSVANCQNGATCVNNTLGVFQYCGCRPGFTGKYCQYQASQYSMRQYGYVDTPDFCSANNPCNGGTCINLVNGVGFTCICPPGYSSSVASSNVFGAGTRTTEEYYCERFSLINASSSIVPSAIFTLVVALFAGLFAKDF